MALRFRGIVGRLRRARAAPLGAVACALVLPAERHCLTLPSLFSLEQVGVLKCGFLSLWVL